MLIRLAFSYFGARALPLLFASAALPVYTRLLSPEEYGYYAKIMALAVLADAALFHWTRMGLLRFMRMYPAGLQGLRSDLYVAGWLTGSVVLSIIGVLLWLTRPEALPAMFWVSSVAFIYAWHELALFNSIGQQRPLAHAAMGTTKAGVALTVGALLAYRGFGGESALIGVLCGCLLGPLLFGRESWRGVQLKLPNLERFRPIAAYSVPLIPTFLLGWVIQGSDRLMLSWLLDDYSVGQYAVGYDLAHFGVGVLLVAVNLAAYPLAIKAFDTGGPNAARSQVRRNGELLVALAAASVVGMTVLSAPLCSILVGPEFERAATVIVPVVALAAGIAGIKSFHLDVALHLGRRSVAILLCMLIGASVNVVLNVLLIPAFGIDGAAWATVLAYTAAAAASAFLGRTAFDMPSLRPILLKASGVSASAGLGALGGAQAAAAYGEVMVLFGGIGCGIVVASAAAYLLDVANVRTDFRKLLTKPEHDDAFVDGSTTVGGT